MLRKKPSFHGVDITGAEYARDLELTDHNGQQRSLKDFRGKVVVVFFGYTQCPDVCPTSLQELAEAKRLLGPDGERLQGIFVTIDPERDTPGLLKAYMANFDPNFIALRGTPEQTAAVAKEFKVYYKKSRAKRPRATPWTIRPAATFSIPRGACACSTATAAARRRWLTTCARCCANHPEQAFRPFSTRGLEV